VAGDITYCYDSYWFNTGLVSDKDKHEIVVEARYWCHTVNILLSTEKYWCVVKSCDVHKISTRERAL
jgi:hypothetical protein